MALVCLTLKKRGLGQTIFVALNNDIAESLKSIGINPIKLYVEYAKDWVEYDSDFKSVVMPGDLSDVLLPNSDFPVWKSLSLDRFYFWFAGKKAKIIIELLETFNITDAVVSLDLDSSITWQIASNIATVAVQCDSALTREFYDLAPYLPYTQVVVRDEESAKFLEKFGAKNIVVVPSGDTPNKFPEVNSLSVKQNLRLASDFITVVIYEAQCEWAFRRWLFAARTKLHLPTNQVAVFVSSSKDRDLILTTCPNFPYVIVDNPIILSAADSIICFRYSESISRGARCPVQVLDIHDRFRSSEIVPQ